jgi:membrane-anchored protein YejM (alkaline phosphatase superfamily)
VRFSNDAWVFKNHFSGGNSTGPGVFSLFYGMPATYWTSMQVQKTGPVLLEELIKQHYQMGVFTSASPQTPALHRTVLQAIKDLQTRQQPGATPDERDRVVTEKFNQFIDRVASTQQPFFSFLFYDSAHTYCSTHDHLGHFHPEKRNCNRLTFTNQTNPVPYRNRYKNALSYVDLQIEQVLTSLKKHRLLDNTIVLITGDHGEEFNDNHLGYWGHASNFTHYQVQTPLIIHWPKQPARVFTHQTNHFDIAPTLMAGLARCKAYPSDYSLGRNLLDTRKRPYLIINSYIDFGIVESDRITTIFPIGNYHIDQLNGQPIAEANLNVATMRQVFQDLRRFYKQ